jgi:magnesium transporter
MLNLTVIKSTCIKFTNNKMGAKTNKVLSLLNPRELIKTKKILNVNPTSAPNRDFNKTSIMSLFTYDSEHTLYYENISLENLLKTKTIVEQKQWLNVDVLQPETVQNIANAYQVHPLIVEDILSANQRPKLDELDKQVYCVLQMMYFNDTEKSIESEQVSFVMGENFLLSFQEDEHRDHFDSVRAKLNIANSKCRKYDIDYLLYSLLDAIVDHYYIVMEKLGESIELIEEDITNGATDNFTMNRINSLRKEMIMFRRNIIPVRDLINNILNTENLLLKPSNKRYFKDVYDHILQAADLSDNYRDMVINIRDLYLNQVNLKINEVMKFLAIVTALLAPATVIGGIFGMNFEKIPWLHNNYGFFLAVGLMLIVPFIMLAWFKKKSWF